MAEKTSPTLRLLGQIRDQLKEIRQEASSTNERLDSVERRQVETEIRLATELVSIGQTLASVRDLLKT